MLLHFETKPECV